MEYEKKYQEAQKWIESIYSELSHEHQMEAEAFFPELKESEDEKIRKWIINEIKIKHHNLDEDNVDFVDKAIAWLEKQKGCEYIKKDWLEHIKQSWYKEGFIDGKYTPKELTINDVATLNELIDFLENGTAKLQHDLTLYANWLKTQFSPNEKQGEQKASYTTIVKTGNGGINALVTRELPTNGCDEQKSAWSEEDECYMSECIGAIATKDGWSFEEKRKTKHWLKALKQRIGG